MFFQYLFTDPQYFIWWIIIVVFSVCVHEFAHAWTAYMEGDDTAKTLGHFSLNPLVHMGPLSLLLLFFIGLCWGACPVNPAKLRSRYSDALVSFAGPLANLLLMVGFAALTLAADITGGFGMPETMAENLSRFLQMAATTNAGLFLLNMIPVPPLDGHAVVRSLIPQTAAVYSSMGNFGYFALLLFWQTLGVAFWETANAMSSRCYYLFAGVVS